MNDADGWQLVVDMTGMSFALVVARDGRARVYGTVDPATVPRMLRNAADQFESGRPVINDIQPDDVDGL